MLEKWFSMSPASCYQGQVTKLLFSFLSNGNRDKMLSGNIRFEGEESRCVRHGHNACDPGDVGILVMISPVVQGGGRLSGKP